MRLSLVSIQNLIIRQIPSSGASYMLTTILLNTFAVKIGPKIMNN